MNYNPANNRITTATSTVTGYVYDGVPVDRSSSMGWDASGNTLYDGINRYWYDAEGARIAKATVFPRYVTAHFAPRFVR